MTVYAVLGTILSRKVRRSEISIVVFVYIKSCLGLGQSALSVRPSVQSVPSVVLFRPSVQSIPSVRSLVRDSAPRRYLLKYNGTKDIHSLDEFVIHLLIHYILVKHAYSSATAPNGAIPHQEPPSSLNILCSQIIKPSQTLFRNHCWMLLKNFICQNKSV